MIGDSVVDDYESSRASGISSILLDRYCVNLDFNGLKVKNLNEVRYLFIKN